MTRLHRKLRIRTSLLRQLDFADTIWLDMPSPQPKFIRIALVLPTEFAYARAVLRGVIAATRERNMYKSEGASTRARRNKPWLFRIYRGIYGHSGRYLRHWFDEWNP